MTAPPRQPRGSVRQREDRQAKVEVLYRELLPPRRIHEILAKQGITVTEVRIRKDIVAIRKRWRAEFLAAVGTPKDVDAWYWQNALQDRRRAISAKDARTAYKILRDMHGIAGGQQPQSRVLMELADNHNVTSLQDAAKEARETLDRVRARRQELKKKVRKR